MSKITPMEAYATTDGRLFSNTLEAQAHQHSLDIKKEVHEFFGYEGKPSYFDTYAAARVLAVIDWEVAKKMKELKEKSHDK
jgi:hypothetical protein